MSISVESIHTLGSTLKLSLTLMLSSRLSQAIFLPSKTLLSLTNGIVYLKRSKPKNHMPIAWKNCLWAIWMHPWTKKKKLHFEKNNIKSHLRCTSKEAQIKWMILILLPKLLLRRKLLVMMTSLITKKTEMKNKGKKEKDS